MVLRLILDIIDLWYQRNLQFEKNLHGDIIAVYASRGTKLIEYNYYAWGTFWTSYKNGGQNTTATKNSLGYRGYYYDKDLEMYYLASRYYFTKICRFISPDDLPYLGAMDVAVTKISSVLAELF